MSMQRLLQRGIPLLLVSFFLGLDALPSSAQPASDRLDIEVRLPADGQRMIGETEKNLIPVLQNVRIHTRAPENHTVVLLFARLSGGEVATRQMSSPLRIDDRAASSSQGVRLGSALPAERLRSVTPLNPAEFAVTDYAPADRWASAADLVEDPGPAFPLAKGDGLLVAAVPADPALRTQSRGRGLLLTVERKSRSIR